MASNFHRLRRVVSLSSYLIQRSLHRPQSVSSHPNLFHRPRPTSAAAATAISTTAFSQLARAFTPSLFLNDQRKPFNPETDEIGPDTILFEGCDYNHWLITVDFPNDTELTREKKIEFYAITAAQVFGRYHGFSSTLVMKVLLLYQMYQEWSLCYRIPTLIQ